MVLEELEHALARGAKIYGEVTGYGATSDGYDMVAPSRAKAANGRCGWRCPPCRKAARSTTSTATAPRPMVGDVTEVEAIRRVFGRGTTPPIASTKSLTGHCLGGAGVWEAIYSLIMMNGNFIAASANVITLDPALDPGEIVTTLRENVATRHGPVELLRLRRHQRHPGHVEIPVLGAAMADLMKGKRGLVMGVANERSIAWGIASALAAEGAELAFTYQGEAFGKRLQPLAAIGRVGLDDRRRCDERGKPRRLLCRARPALGQRWIS